jgi:hypothetical protein
LEVTLNTEQLKRLAAGIGTASLLTMAMAAPAAAAPPDGSSRSIVVTGIAQGVLDSYSISAGESVPFSVTIQNAGRQTINSVRLLFGRDDNPLPASNGDATPPTALPAGATVSSTTAGCNSAPAATLTCALGTFPKGRTVVVNAVFATSESTLPASFLTEAVVSVAEGTGDNGSNIDTFSAQGSPGISILGFSCEQVTAYRPGSANKVVSTCAIDADGEANDQQARVKIPARLTTVVLTENPDAACPVLSGVDCIGDEVDANVSGDTTSDVISWELRIALNGQSVTLNKLVVVHTNDEGGTTQISLAKKNACKTASATNCGSASVVDGVLIVTVQTPGNGKTRLLG